MDVDVLTLLLLKLNSLQDSGKYSDITIDDIHNASNDRNVLGFLSEKAGNDLDLSLYFEGKALGEDFEASFEHDFFETAGGVQGRERKKMGVENFGICFAIAVVIDMIQQGLYLNWQR